MNYRLLYFFHSRNVAVLAHGLTKEQKIPQTDLLTVIARKARFAASPKRHTHEE